MIVTAVGKLAIRSAGRRDFDAGRLQVAGLCLASALSFAAAPVQAAAAWQDTAEIAAAAETFLEQRAGRRSDATSFQADAIDPRLRLARCDQPLSAFLRDGTRIGARTIVGVRCAGAQPWKLYVTVSVVSRLPVWIAARPLPRGHIVTRDDIFLEERDVSRQAAYVTDAGALIGARLRTSVLAGTLLTTRLVEATALVRRGQTVTLAVTGGGVSIRMAGKALMDGALNQRIRVENLNSGRVVEGIVRSREMVEILVPRGAENLPEPTKGSAVAADTAYSNNDR